VKVGVRGDRIQLRSDDEPTLKESEGDRGRPNDVGEWMMGT
jgi:hypothetical protein